jgi:hypothetical protein
MASKPVAQVASMSTNLQRTFENAVRDIYQAGRKGPSYRMPIVQRTRVAADSSVNTQKKALSDAAKALAQLWKVAPSSGR